MKHDCTSETQLKLKQLKQMELFGSFQERLCLSGQRSRNL